MFESILIRQSQSSPATAMDPGVLAEALLFYKQTIIAGSTGDIATLANAVGPDDFIGLIDDGHIAVTLIEDMLATMTETKRGVEEHKFLSFELAAGRNKKKLSREDKIRIAAERNFESRWTARRFAKHLAQKIPHRKFDKEGGTSNAVIAAALGDLDDYQYVRAAVTKVFEIYAPNYIRSRPLVLDIIKTSDSFILGHNIDWVSANEEFHRQTSIEIASLTAAFLIGHILSARGEMHLSADYLSELVTSPVHAALIDLRYRDLLLKRGRNASEIHMFEDAFLEGRTLREVINSGERTFGEFRKLLDGARRFKNWLSTVNPDQHFIAEYHKAATASTWVESLPVKTLRFAICSAAGVMGAPLGLTAGAVDAFLLEKLLRGWRPHHFVQGPLTKFVDPGA